MSRMRNESTGQFEAKPLTGMLCGRLTVLAPTGESRHGYRVWKCRCECGTERDMSSQVLLKAAKGVRGGVKSCGCLKKGRPVTSGNPILNALLASRRGAAKARGYEWGLTRAEAFALFKGDCAYCGAPPLQVYRNTTSPANDAELYNGIDRVRNDAGYVAGNCVSCCGACNISKATRSVEEFRAWAQRLHARCTSGWPA